MISIVICFSWNWRAPSLMLKAARWNQYQGLNCQHVFEDEYHLTLKMFWQKKSNAQKSLSIIWVCKRTYVLAIDNRQFRLQKSVSFLAALRQRHRMAFKTSYILELHKNYRNMFQNASEIVLKRHYYKALHLGDCPDNCDESTAVKIYIMKDVFGRTE